MSATAGQIAVVVGVGGGRLSLPLSVPDLSPSLARLDHWLDAVLNPHPDIGRMPRVPESIRDAAFDALAAIAPLLCPAPRDVLSAWLWPIANGVEWTPDDGEFNRRIAALEMVAGEVPGVAWTVDAQRDGLRQWRRFPSVAAIVELVSGPVRPLISRARGLRLLAALQAEVV